MNINILFLIMLWTVAPFFKKWAMLSMSSSQYLVFQSLIILPLNCLRGYSNDKQTILSPSFNMWFFLSVFGTWVASVIFMLLCKELKPTDFIPVVQPAVIVLTNIIDILLGMKIKSKNILKILNAGMLWMFKLLIFWGPLWSCSPIIKSIYYPNALCFEVGNTVTNLPTFTQKLSF